MRNTFANVVLNNASTGVESDENCNTGTGNLDDENQEQVAVTSNMHPLYLQNIDHPGLVLIAKKLTGTETFGPWKRSITIALSAKNKLGLVDGTFPKPDSKSPLKAQYDRVNDMIISWILNTVSDEISLGMDFVNSAEDLWNELHEQFASINGHRVYQVLKDLHALEQGDKSVEVYYHKMKNLWDEYSALEPVIVCKCSCTCDFHKLQEERDQRKKLLQFLMGLNESFAAARGQVLMMNPLPSVPQAYSLIKQEERQRQGYMIHNSFVANAKVSTQSSASSNGLGASAIKKPGIKCTYCHKDGHLKESCYKLIGYPPRGRGRGRFGNSGVSGVFKQQPFASNSAHVALGNDDAVNVVSSQPRDCLQPFSSGQPLHQFNQQPSLEQLQQQMAQMSQLMTTMFQNKLAYTTPEDHVAGPF